MSDLFVKPKGVRYVDMAIWIDENIHNETFDEGKAFEYMYLLARMLAYKSKYFRDATDYDGFACYLACSVYARLTDREKPPIKSVLNYMKSIKYFRKVAYEHEAYSEVIDPAYVKTWDSDVYREKNISSIESENRRAIASASFDFMKTLPKLVLECIPSMYHGSAKKHLYISSLLTLIYGFTLKPAYQEKLDANLDNPTFRIVDFYRANLDEKIIRWRLDETYSDTVQLIVNKVKNEISGEIKDIVNDYKISEKQFDDMSIETIFEG